MVNNIFELLNIILEQDCLLVVTFNLELEETDQNSPEMLKGLNLEKENLHEKIMNSFSQPLEITLEQKNAESELSTSNSALQEVYSNSLENGENSPWKQHLLLLHPVILI